MNMFERKQSLKPALFPPRRLDNEVLLDYGVLDTANAKAGYTLRLSLSSEDKDLDDKTDVLEVWRCES